MYWGGVEGGGLVGGCVLRGAVSEWFRVWGGGTAYIQGRQRVCQGGTCGLLRGQGQPGEQWVTAGGLNPLNPTPCLHPAYTLPTPCTTLHLLACMRACMHLLLRIKHTKAHQTLDPTT